MTVFDSMAATVTRLAVSGDLMPRTLMGGVVAHVIRERTSITLSVLEPSQTPTPLCYQGVIFSHTPPSPLP